MVQLRAWLRRYQPSLILIGAIALVHGWLLLNDGVYFDGWFVYNQIEDGDFETLRQPFSDQGNPLRAWQHWIAGQVFDPVLGHKAVSFVCLLLAGVILYRIGVESQFLSQSESFFLALLTLFYPAYQASVEMIMMPYHVSFVSFFGGVWLALRLKTAAGGRGMALRLACYGLFILAFLIQSFLVFYFAFLVFWGMYTAALDLRSNPLRAAVWQVGRFYPDFVLLPMGFWLVTRTLFPIDARYNEFSLSLPTLTNGFFNFLRFGVYGQLQFSLERLLAAPLLTGLALLMLQPLYRVYAKRHGAQGSSRSVAALLVSGLLALILAMLPYVVVGKSPTLHGWYSRHALLLGLPMAILTLGIWRGIKRLGDERTHWLGFMLVGLLLLGYGLAHWQNYITLQARWIKDRSVIEHLRQANIPRETGLLWVDDRFFVGWDELFYYNHEWTGMVIHALGRADIVGLPYDDAGSFRWARNNYNGVDYPGIVFRPTACQAIVTIERGDRPAEYSDAAVSLRYLFYRYGYRAGLSDFLLGVTRVQVRRILAPEAVDCPVEQAYLPLVGEEDVMRQPTATAEEHIHRLHLIIKVEREIAAIPQPDNFGGKAQQQALTQVFFDALRVRYPQEGLEPFPALLEEADIDREFYYRYYLVSNLFPPMQP